jgi:hypothetical protein
MTDVARIIAERPRHQRLTRLLGIEFERGALSDLKTVPLLDALRHRRPALFA